MIASFSTNDNLRWMAYALSCCFYTWICYITFSIFQATYDRYPDTGKQTVEMLALVFFASWTSFPILWMLGGEGSGIISHRASVCAHGVADLISKNLFGYLAWYLRWNKTRTLDKQENMKTIMRRAATGDIPRVLIVGSSKDAYTKRYLADVSCKIGFVADVVDDFSSFERVINERQVPSWSKGYSAVIINVSTIRDVIAMEEDLHNGEITLREKLGTVPVIGYDTAEQDEVHAEELFRWFAVTQVLRCVTVDNSIEGEVRATLSKVIELAVDQHLERLAGTATATKDPRKRYGDHGQVSIAVESFSPKKIAILSPKVVKDKAKKKTRRPSIIGNLLKKSNDKSTNSRFSRSRSASPTSISRGSTHSMSNTLSSNSRGRRSNDISHSLASTLSRSRSNTLQRNSPEANNMKDAIARNVRNSNSPSSQQNSRSPHRENGNSGNGDSLQNWEREVRNSAKAKQVSVTTGAPRVEMQRGGEPSLPRRGSPNGAHRNMSNGRSNGGMIHL